MLKIFNKMQRYSALSILSISSLLMFVFVGCGGGSTAQSADNTADTALQAQGHGDLDEVLYLKTKREFSGTQNSVTTYTYDTDNYLIKSTETADGIENLKMYKYFEDHHVLKTYENDKLISITTFEDVSAPKAMPFFKAPLSLTAEKRYIYHEHDALINNDNLQIKTYISYLDFGGMSNRVKRYHYDANDLLIKQQDGHYDLSRDVAEQLFVETNTSFLLAEDETTMPFEVTQAYRYSYNNSMLTERAYDIYDDGVIESSEDAEVTYHANGTLKTLNLANGDRVDYNENGLLTAISFLDDDQVRVYHNYRYSEDGKQVTVTDANSAETIVEYIFE